VNCAILILLLPDAILQIPYCCIWLISGRKEMKFSDSWFTVSQNTNPMHSFSSISHFVNGARRFEKNSDLVFMKLQIPAASTPLSIMKIGKDITFHRKVQRQESSNQLSTFPWSICNGLAKGTLSQLPQTESSNKQEGKGITQ
jgi:hypothetical protein